jgi:hypothetical protein
MEKGIGTFLAGMLFVMFLTSEKYIVTDSDGKVLDTKDLMDRFVEFIEKKGESKQTPQPPDNPAK